MSVRVLITDNDLGDSRFEQELLERELGAEVTIAECSTEDDVLSAVRVTNPTAILVQWAPITAAVLDAAPDCRIVSRIGIGVDMIDLDAAASRGIEVRNVPHYCTEEVATHAIALGLALWRRLLAFDEQVRSGGWDAASASEDIGLGRIGRLVAHAFDALGARVIVHDPVAGDDSYPRVGLAELAAESDLISLHAPLTAETHHVVDTAFLDGCRKRPYLVNVSRGGLVDTAALGAALEAGRIAGAGLDVFEEEPLAEDNALRTAPGTILTPHAAWCSRDALPALREQAARNIVAALSNRSS